ncbi:MAG: DEAD/DEAH box helicase [Candidatus Kerfeldbacteria bacterium]|nr:DEAD/DEAH box helicase [Candidatus Kerfeldbacteria bacterium]
MTNPQPARSFHGLGIAPRLLEQIARLGFSEPTPIQQQAIPPAIDGKDVVGIAQTGTGKTLAFGIPTIQRLAQVKGRALIVLPTRELAQQVDEALLRVGRAIGLRTAVLIGGASMYGQIKQLTRSPHLVIATPGRLIDHLEQKRIRLGDIRILVLDEADRMLDMGFAPQLRRILAAVPPPAERQTMLFSATIPDAIMQIARNQMRLPVRIEVARSGTAAETVAQEVFVVPKQDKTRLLEKILLQTRGSVLVFMRTKHTAKRLTRLVKAMGHTAAELHANRTLSQRRAALDGFKQGIYRVLVATDIAARGIDVTGIELVVNYDLPSVAEAYVHRIGRTGRAGQVGKAISFVMPDQQRDLRQIERLIRMTLKVSRLPELPPARPKPAFEPQGRPRRSSFSPQSRGGYAGSFRQPQRTARFGRNRHRRRGRLHQRH